MEKNSILNVYHHGGRKFYSTITAMTLINNKLLYNKENSIISTILCTDLSAAYNTVNTDILLKKLEHYGFRGGINNIFKSYFQNRMQYVSLDTFNSKIVNSPKGSCIQGSKMSGTLYNLYVNEVPDIHKLLYDPLFKKITGKNTQFRYKGIEHITLNYIDDSNNIISCKDHSHIKHYVEDYYLLLHEYYNINNLKINPDKNKIIIISPNKFNNIFKKLSFRTQNYIIRKSNIIKILGSYIQSDLKMDKEIGELCANLHHRIHNLKQISHYTDFKSRLSFLNSFVIGKLQYMLPMYSNAPDYLLTKLHKVIMSGARTAIGSYCFKKSCSYILGKCKWMSIKDMIICSGIINIHKFIIKKEPKCMLTLFKEGRNIRNATRVYTKYIPKTVNMNNYYIYKCLEKFYELPKDIQNVKFTLFKKKLKQYISTHLVPFDTAD